jgi:hypothetical protein
MKQISSEEDFSNPTEINILISPFDHKEAKLTRQNSVRKQ